MNINIIVENYLLMFVYENEHSTPIHKPASTRNAEMNSCENTNDDCTEVLYYVESSSVVVGRRQTCLPRVLIFFEHSK